MAFFRAPRTRFGLLTDLGGRLRRLTGWIRALLSRSVDGSGHFGREHCRHRSRLTEMPQAILSWSESEALMVDNWQSWMSGLGVMILFERSRMFLVLIYVCLPSRLSQSPWEFICHDRSGKTSPSAPLPASPFAFFKASAAGGISVLSAGSRTRPVIAILYAQETRLLSIRRQRGV